MPNIKRLIAFAEHKLVIKMEYLYDMEDDCIMLTDSGGRKRYVAGILNSGGPFVEKCSPQFSENQ